MNPLDPLLFLDFIIIVILIAAKKITIRTVEVPKLSKRLTFIISIGLIVLNLSLAEIQRPQLLTRIFDRAMVVKYLGIYNYHLLDMFVTSKSTAQRVFAEGNDIIEVENYVNQQPTSENDFTGIAKGKNVILISMESFQNFLIDYKVNGKEVTPFLNELTKSSYYFNNFYHQTGQGKTSDAEFLIDNSLYPLPRGAVFTTNSQNEYNALPEILKDNGYSTASFHGNNKSFWNRDVMYKTLGYDHYFSEEYYHVTEENSINYGLKDIPFFEQSIPLLQSLPKPFYAKMLTLTNHYPYLLDEEDEMIEDLTTGDGSVDRYVQTANYLDYAVQLFFEDLKESGLYEDSIIILYGDHYGISENHNRAMAEVVGKEITPYEHVQLQKVPLIIHIPGQEQGETMDTISGLIDMKPTIMNLLGVKEESDIQFGRDLFDKDRREFVIERDGSFITDELLYTKEICYDRATGLTVESVRCEDLRDKAEQELFLSDKVIQRDLFRFLELEEEVTTNAASKK
jgi:lipoteichoic acid synthase